MKDITNIINEHEPKPDYSLEQKHRVKNFVLSVFQLFPNYRQELTDEENVKSYCRIHAHKVVLFPPKNYQERLEKVEALVSQQNLQGLIGNYKNAVHALAAACGAMDRLNHDYRIAFPSHQGASGALQHIEDMRSMASTEEKALSELDKLKGIFK
jgi:hypothetical protein